jgi:hypothetical protein
MSSRYDILDAKARYDAHSCDRSHAYPCLVKRGLWQERVRIAGLWGIESGDDERQRDQFNERTKTGAST